MTLTHARLHKVRRCCGSDKLLFDPELTRTGEYALVAIFLAYHWWRRELREPDL